MNGRPLSPFIRNFFESRAALNSRAYNTHLAFKITLSTGALIYFSTHPLVVTSLSRRGASVTLGIPLTFLGKVLSPPEIQFSQTASTDGSTQFTVTNLDYLLSSLIPEDDRLFDGASVTVYLCFPKPDGSYEGLIYGVGRLRTVQGDHEFAPISYVSDLSDKSVVAGGRPLTQRCLNVFRVFGDGESWCGAAFDYSIGVGATCSHIYDDDKNGCKFWGQEATYHGVPFFNPNGLVAGYGGTVSGGGWQEPPVIGGGGCYDVDSFYKTVDGDLSGRQIIRGTQLLNAVGEIATVETTEIIFAPHRYFIETLGGASAIVSADHPLLTYLADNKGTAAFALALSLDPANGGRERDIYQWQVEQGITPPDEDGVRIVQDVAGLASMSPFTMRVTAAGNVLKIGLTAPNTYLAGRKPKRYVGGHNTKPVWTTVN